MVASVLGRIVERSGEFAFHASLGKPPWFLCGCWLSEVPADIFPVASATDMKGFIPTAWQMERSAWVRGGKCGKSSPGLVVSCSILATKHKY